MRHPFFGTIPPCWEYADTGKEVDAMPDNIVVLGEDRRQYWVAKHLAAAGHCVSTFGVTGLEDTRLTLAWTAADAQVAVLPMPAADSSGNIRLSCGRTLDCRLLPVLLPPGIRLFGGLLPDCLPGTDYALSDAVTTANAIPTAEGAIGKAMELLPITIWNSRCLIIGFGRIGKVLAHRLHAMGAKVTVAARRAGDLVMITGLGCESDITGEYRNGLLQYDCIFNTVPAMVLPEAQLQQTRPDCLIIDLASRPGGIDFAACAELPRQAVHALSLPGQVAPATAGKIISNYILEQL